MENLTSGGKEAARSATDFSTPVNIACYFYIKKIIYVNYPFVLKRFLYI